MKLFGKYLYGYEVYNENVYMGIKNWKQMIFYVNMKNFFPHFI